MRTIINIHAHALYRLIPIRWFWFKRSCAHFFLLNFYLLSHASVAIGTGRRRAARRHRRVTSSRWRHRGHVTQCRAIRRLAAGAASVIWLRRVWPTFTTRRLPQIWWHRLGRAVIPRHSCQAQLLMVRFNWTQRDVVCCFKKFIIFQIL